VIDVNGGTRVTLDKRNARLATLEYGEAKFSVVHDATAPFRVNTGGAQIEDVGTIFNVTRDAGQTIVAVADGSVVYNPKQQAVLVTRGRVLRALDATKVVNVSTVNPKLIGGWTSGSLAYEDTPLTSVAADLSRALGKPITTAPSLAMRHFTGTIIIDRKDADAMGRIAALLGVNATPNAKGWQLTPR
jgi:transmembrane sensor